MWGGRFDGSPAAAMEAINVSIDTDKRLYLQDIRGSIAHAEMLAAQGLLTRTEEKKITGGLRAIQKDIEADNFPFRRELEDIHMAIEAALTERIGEAGRKLHTARSRNDQVATDFRLWVRDAIDLLDGEFAAFQAALLDRAEEHAATIFPGHTHLQAAQPVTFGHHLLAYAEMTGRDRARLRDARVRLNESPLGAAALAGTSFPVDRHRTAKALGFDGPMRNSLDAVSDRDFALEFLAALSIAAMHLSRLAEEIILWMSAGFGWITLSAAFTTGSSIMPQKRNPDAAELIRAKTGQIYGALTALLTVMKGLPLAYNKDMQEDKRPVFEATDALLLCLSAMTGMVRDMRPDAARMHLAAEQGFSTATDLADWLVRSLRIPFRDSHHITGRIVRLAEEKGCRLEALPLAALQKIEPRITKAVYEVLSVEYSVRSRTSFGGTAPANVKKSVQEARKRFI